MTLEGYITEYSVLQIDMVLKAINNKNVTNLCNMGYVKSCWHKTKKFNRQTIKNKLMVSQKCENSNKLFLSEYKTINKINSNSIMYS